MLNHSCDTEKYSLLTNASELKFCPSVVQWSLLYVNYLVLNEGNIFGFFVTRPYKTEKS